MFADTCIGSNNENVTSLYVVYKLIHCWNIVFYLKAIN